MSKLQNAFIVFLLMTLFMFSYAQAGYDPIVLVLAQITTKDGKTNWNITNIPYSEVNTTSKAGEVIKAASDELEVIKKPIPLEWGHYIDAGKDFPILLDLTKPTQTIELPNHEIYFLDGNGAKINTILTLTSFGKICSDTPTWKYEDYRNIKSIKFYFQLTSEVKKKILEQYSFANHFNTCAGSKLKLGRSPYSSGGDGGGFEWLYNLKKIDSKVPDTISMVHGDNGMTDVIEAWENKKDYVKMRNAALILCEGKSSLTSGGISFIITSERDEFKDFPAQFRKKLDEDYYVLNAEDLYGEFWKNVPKEMEPSAKVRKELEKELDENGEYLTPAKTPLHNKLIKVLGIRCKFDLSIPEGL